MKISKIVEGPSAYSVYLEDVDAEDVHRVFRAIPEGKRYTWGATYLRVNLRVKDELEAYIIVTEAIEWLGNKV